MFTMIEKSNFKFFHYLILIFLLVTSSLSFSAPCERSSNITFCGVVECKCKWDPHNKTCYSVNNKNCCIYDNKDKCKNNWQNACFQGGCGGWCGSSSRNTAVTCEAPANPIVTPQEKKYIIKKDISNDINNKKAKIYQDKSNVTTPIKERIYD